MKRKHIVVMVFILMMVPVLIFLTVCPWEGDEFSAVENSTESLWTTGSEIFALTEPENMETETETVYINANGDPSVEEHLSVNKMDFADLIGGEAEALYGEYQLLPSAVTAYAVFESLWGISDAASVHNYYNFEYVKGCGTDCQIFFYEDESDLKTDEGHSYTVAFRKYDTVHNGIEDFIKDTVRKHPDLSGEEDYHVVLNTIDPDNAKMVIEILEQYQFDERYDHPVVRKAD